MARDPPYNILVVDDDQRVRNLLWVILSNSKEIDCTVKKAADGEEALDMIENQDFDLIVSDHKMEPITGIELLKEIKEKYPSITRILITGYSELELAKEAINEAEVHSYLEKPWSNGELKKTVKNILDQ